MRDSGAANYMDCLGIHYNAGATSPDAGIGHPADSGGQHYSWYFKPTMNLYASVFPSQQLCFTEMGYLSPEGYGYTPPTFWWGAGTTVFEQAEWLSRAVNLARTSGKIEGPGGAAELLGINPHTLRSRMRKLGIDWSAFRTGRPT